MKWNYPLCYRFVAKGITFVTSFINFKIYQREDPQQHHSAGERSEGDIYMLKTNLTKLFL